MPVSAQPGDSPLQTGRSRSLLWLGFSAGFCVGFLIVNINLLFTDGISLVRLQRRAPGRGRGGRILFFDATTQCSTHTNLMFTDIRT